MEKEQQQTDKKVEKKVDPASLAVPETLSLLPLHGFVFYPGMGFPLQVAAESSKQLIDDALLGDRMIGLVTTRKTAPEGVEHLTANDLYQVGVVGYIHKLSKEREGYYHVVVSGTKKIEIVKVVETIPYH
ncbi:MAG: LON peptidase substrate-binding domain-containing protein, partial [Desulfobulbaceae bacterium]|nr:LON peptidase substrate-binding domain-containing protein [Desulfobulbaceae bacterium]